jgi:hypothetical protein
MLTSLSSIGMVFLMKNLSRLGAALLCSALVLSAARLPAAESARSATAESTAPDAKRLVEQLGDRKFAAREAAARSLLAIGFPAMGPLQGAAGHSDAEVRYRAGKILAELRQRDFQRRLHAFAANTDGADEYDLPGWREFRQLAGDSRAARELFVEMQSEEPILMQLYGDDPKSAGELIEIRTAQLLQRMGFQEQSPVSLGSAAAMIFVAGREEAPVSDAAAGGIYRICVDQSISANLSGGAYQDILRELLSAWISRSAGSSADYQKLTLAMQYNLPAGLAPAVEILEQAGHPPHLRQQAIVTVVKFGDQLHIPLLERYLNDDTEYGRRQLGNRNDVATQIRDVALAGLVMLTKQDLAAFGMGHVTTAPSLGFIPWSCGFEDDAARQKALAQWRTSREKATAAKAGKPS